MAAAMYQWQEKAVETFIQRERGIIQATTASGKSRCAVKCMLEIEPRMTHIVVPKIVLMEQWIDELRLGGYTGKVALHGGGHENDYEDVNIWTINTARTRLNNPDAGKDALLIVDEVHRSVSAKNRELYRMKPKWCLGISATAFKNGTYIANLIGGGLIYNYTFEDALADGVVSDYEIVNVGYRISRITANELADMADRIRQLRSMISDLYGDPGSDDAWPIFIAQLADEEPMARSLQHLWIERKRLLWSNRERIDITKDLVDEHSNQRIVIFHQEISGVDEIYRELTEEGYVCAREHSGLDKYDREIAMARFRSGEAQIMVACRTLDEGFNVPDVEVGIIAASSSTSTQYIQRVGRMLRKSANKAEICSIYRISAMNTVDEFATHNLLASGAVSPERVRFVNHKTQVEYTNTQHHRVSAATIGLTTKKLMFIEGQNRGDRIFLRQHPQNQQLIDYLHRNHFECGRFRIGHNNDLYIWNNNRFANIGRSPVSWQLLQQRLPARIALTWRNMAEPVEEEE